MRVRTLALLLPAAAFLSAQVHAIRGARIHPLDGPVIPRGNLVMEKGRITALGPDAPIPPGAIVTEGEGLEAYPGLFDAVSQLGLQEAGFLQGARDVQELGDQPQLRAAWAIHPETAHLPIARSSGITHACALPGLNGRMALGGQASAVSLAGATVEEMLVESAVGLVLNVPAAPRTEFFFEAPPAPRAWAEVRAEVEQKLARLDAWFEKARHCAQGGHPRDLALEALGPYVRGEKPVLAVAQRRREILDVLALAERHKLRLVLVGGQEAVRVKERLAAQKVPVILGPTWQMPRSEDDPYDRPMTLAAELHAAGIPVAIASFSPSGSRDLPFQAGTAAAYGLPREEALRAITVNPARILGLDSALGTLAPGKTANLILTTGDPLEFRTQVKAVFIQGRPAPLDDRQKQLYERYRTRR